MASQQNKISATEDATSTSAKAKTVEETPVSTCSADNVLSASDVAATVGGVVVIEHVQDAGEANEEHGGA